MRGAPKVCFESSGCYFGSACKVRGALVEVLQKVLGVWRGQPNFFWGQTRYSQAFVFPSFWPSLSELFRVNSYYKTLHFVNKKA